MEIILNDDEEIFNDCEHKFTQQSNLNIDGIIYDIFFCEKCLMHAKKERPCPYNLKKINNDL